MEYVEIATARQHPGLVLVSSALVPSPWSEAAKGIFEVKGLAVLGVRARPRDAEVLEWTHSHNVPVVLYGGEAPRTGWAEILTLAERLGGKVSLVPGDAEQRCQMFGLAHEIAGENGLGWCARLLMIDGSLRSEGAHGFPLRAAKYLASKYGYAPERAPRARARVREILERLAAELERSDTTGNQRYLLGSALTALDLYLATFLQFLVGVSETDCPSMPAELRPAFSYLKDELGLVVPRSLLEHRAFMYSQHLSWPLSL